MKIRITGEQQFTTSSGNVLAIGPSATGYTLAYSVDGDTFTEYEESVPAGENCFVEGAIQGAYYKLIGNVGEVKIIC